MKRRDFLVTASAASTVALMPNLANAFVGADYKPGLVSKELAAGNTVFLDFFTHWCTTCAAQERVINALRAENPAYDESISFINIDWDKYRGADITKELNIPRRSTLVALRGDAEIGRIIAGTSRRDIQALMDKALAAATS